MIIRFSVFSPSLLVPGRKSDQLVSGVGHCHRELQHPLGETRRPPGRLPPASLAYVWLDHVPGETLASYSNNSIFLGFAQIFTLLMYVGEEGP